MNTKSLLIMLILYNYHNKIVIGKNILAVLPVQFSSHLRPFIPLLEALIRNEHNVTVISKYSLGDHLHNKYHHVEVKINFQLEGTPSFYEEIRMNRFKNFMFIFDYFYHYSKAVLHLPELQNFINSQDHYDVVMTELFYKDIFFAFGYKFKAPVIALSSTHLTFCHSWILGNPYPSSYIPNYRLGYTENMSLSSRMYNSVFNLFCVVYYEWVMLPKIQKQVETFFNFDKNDIPSIKEIMRNTSLVLVNSHYSLGYMKPELPNVVNIGGLHYPSSNALSENMEAFLEGANDGVIYLSMGSFVEPKNLVELGDTFIRTLKNFPQRVIMKWDPKLLTNIPENILIEKWISQTKVLNHPNCRLFITHGGMHSVFESVNACVPILGIPMFSDQHYNMAAAEYHGIGKMVPFDKLSSDKLSSEIDEILNNPKYKQNMIKRSKLFRDRLTNPLDEAVFWVEHVMKHKTTSHLKSAAVQLTWYEFYGVDVLVILLSAILLTLMILKSLITWILRDFVSRMGVWIFHRYQRSERKDYKTD